MWKPKSLIDTLVPVYILHVLFCHGVIQHPNIEISKINYSFLWSIVSTISYCACFFFVFWLRMESSWYTNGPVCAYVILIVAVFFTMNVNTVVSWIYKNEILILNSKLIKSDEFLKNLGVSINIQHEFAFSMKFAVGWFIYSFYINAVAIIWYNKSSGLLMVFIVTFTFHHGFHVNYIVDLKFFLLIIHMRARFKGINKFLSDSFNLRSNNLFQNTEAYHKWAISRETNFENDFTTTFLSIKRIHLELKIMCNEIMRIYGFSISLMILTMFFLVIVQLYNIYTIIVKAGDQLTDKSLQIFSMSSWVLIALLKFFCVNYACAKAINEWNKTGEIIHKLELDSKDSKFQREIQKFSIQILQNPLKFTPCGLFDLDYYFIRDFAGSVTAQLVLLIQTTSHDDSSSQKIIKN